MYKEIGGIFFLDNDYMVFGEIVEGIEIIDKIVMVLIGDVDWFVEDVWMMVKIL